MSFLDRSVVEKFANFGKAVLLPGVSERDKSAVFDSSIWQKMAEFGLFSLGREADSLDLPMVVSAFYGLAKGGQDLPLTCTVAAHAVIARDLLLRFGTERQLETYLAPMEKGLLQAAISNHEPGAGADLRNIKSECRATGENSAKFKFYKPCVTNGGRSGSLFFVSAWEVPLEGKPQIAVYLVERGEAESVDLAPDFAIFRTGSTGAIRGEVTGFPYRERRLNGNTFHVFRHCFHLERLLIGAITAGLIAGIEDSAHQMYRERAAKHGASSAQQWVQDKLLRISATRIQLQALLEQILAQPEDLSLNADRLSVLKLLVNENAFDAVNSYFELMGHAGLQTSNLAQKHLRDVAAFRFFGGTTELQKTALFESLQAQYNTDIEDSAKRSAA